MTNENGARATTTRDADNTIADPMLTLRRASRRIYWHHVFRRRRRWSRELDRLCADREAA